MCVLTVFTGTDGRPRSHATTGSPADTAAALLARAGAFPGACAGRSAVDPVLPVSVLREPCQRRANHHDPVTTAYLTGGEPGPVAKARTAARGRARDSPGRYRDLTRLRRRQRRGPARLRAHPPVRARPGPQRPGLLRRTRGAEPVLGHRRRLPGGVLDHTGRRGAVRRAAEHRR